MTVPQAGYYLSFIFVTLGTVTLFFMDCWKRRHHKHDSRHYSDNRTAFVEEVSRADECKHADVVLQD